MTKLSDIGERGAIDILARIYDRGQPIGLGHDCGVVDWEMTTSLLRPMS